mgnify:CR=1 FL=1
MTFLDDPNPAKNDQAVRAASMIHASASMFRTLRDGHLEPDVFPTKVLHLLHQYYFTSIEAVKKTVMD